jgi:hypothetical protein
MRAALVSAVQRVAQRALAPPIKTTNLRSLTKAARNAMQFDTATLQFLQNCTPTQLLECKAPAVARQASFRYFATITKFGAEVTH